MDVTVRTEAAALGLSQQRLSRIDGWMDRLVGDGKLAGLSVTVARRGCVAYSRCTGLADRERGTAMAEDTIVRIYSMTKPLASVAIMMLYEEGHFQLDDPITRFLPYFANQRVLTGGTRGKVETVPAVRDLTFRDLLTHTSGLTYGFMEATLVDALYRSEGVDFQSSDATLAEVVERAAHLPLLAQPGTAWNYSIATDVLGHLVAVISGRPFEEFLQDRVIGPLGMVDTGFHVPTEKVPRFAANYGRGPDGALKLIDDPASSRFAAPRAICSGGGGLCSTAGDYLRFCQMMLNKGKMNGVRLLGRKTVELITVNHLGGDMAAMGQPRFSESSYEGIGFGLGFSVMLDPARAQVLGTPGEYAWGGAASTAFWIDPVEDMAVILLTQLMPSSTYPIRRELRVLSYQAIVD
ncbi:class A beta-lactamase-related serine hydrolase [Roseomonas sp. KE2513]|uniref:serine hydrolase domain-containing protein n=1 Tax=Roseomonas sp. KE2513 TaxID=2479202 RepID=UPI0018DFBA3F|nr:serine hydrolase domain-containing protein [Roseomonas sp. KE2513]MBI0539703.1 class A beta-lactamase-related serine hydrolase [Roseomonas sp. KE2513]